MAGVPLAKLAALAIKTLSKPVAKGIKSRVITYPSLRGGCIQLGQMSHRVMANVTILAAGHTRSRIQVKPLEESDALNRGTELISEAFIFTVAGGTIVWEYARTHEKNKLKEAKKAAQEQEYRDYAHAHIGQLEARVAEMGAQLARVEASLGELGEGRGASGGGGGGGGGGWWRLRR